MNVRTIVDRFRTILSKHLFILVYFAFFILALIPTIFDSLSIVISSTFTIAYKGFLMLSLFAFLCFLIIKKKIKISHSIVCFLLLFIVVYSIYILIFPSVFTFVSPSYSYRPDELISIAFSKTMKLSSLFNIFSIAFFSFISLYFIPSIGLGVNDLKVYLYLICTFALASCIFAFAFQSESIFASDAYIVTKPFASFFGNKNTFGFFLMIATFSACCLFYRFHLKRFAIYAFIFVVVSLLSRSTTTALLSALIFISTYFLFIVNKFFKKKIILVLLLVCPFVVLGFLITGLVMSGHGSAVINLIKKLEKIDFNNLYTLFSGRGGYWAFGIYLLDKDYFLFGYPQPLLDNIIFESVVNMYTTRSLTSTFLTVLDTYGIIGFSLFTYFLYTININIVKIEDRIIKRMLMLLFVVYIVYGLFESYLLFDTKIGSIILTPLLAGFSMTLSKKEKAKSLTKNKDQILYLEIEI